MRIGELVRSNINKIIAYCQTDPAELHRLMDRDYSKKAFDINKPFFEEADRIVTREHSKRYWGDVYLVNQRRFRACSQWYRSSRKLFIRYLVDKKLARTEGFPEAEQPSRQFRKARYGLPAIGNAQNLFIRYILSRLGDEAFNESDWIATKGYFNNSCAYCDAKGSLQMDHAIPINKAKLGEHRLGNLIPSCKTCNDRKHYKDYREFLGSDIQRISKIELYMQSRGYTPLGDDEQIRSILELAHDEVAQLAARYVAVLDVLLDPEADAKASEDTAREG